jgi:acetolactate synthase-1/3 small subunit
MSDPASLPFSAQPAQTTCQLMVNALGATRQSGCCQPIVDTNPVPAGAGAQADFATAVIELRVRNHPGVMSHITGLFARRAFNLEAILCAPCRGDADATSRMLLLVPVDTAIEQVERQLMRLHDVLEIRHRTDLDREFFAQALPP